MPQSPFGLVGAGGVRGAQDALLQLIARRKADELRAAQQAQQEILNRQRDAQIQAQMLQAGAAWQRSEPEEPPSLEDIRAEAEARAAGTRAGAPPAPAKSLADIQAEAEARAAGQRAGAPPIPPQPDRGRFQLQQVTEPDPEHPGQTRMSVYRVDMDNPQAPAVRVNMPGEPGRTPVGGGSQPGQMEARGRAALGSLTRMQTLSKSLHTVAGPGQIVKGLTSRAGAALQTNPAAAEYEMQRRMLASQLAALVQGSRPSDLDQKVYDAATPALGTRKDVAQNMFTNIRRVAEMAVKAGGISVDDLMSELSKYNEAYTPYDTSGAAGPKRIIYDENGNPIRQ